MNRIFRIIWSRALHTWVVASELATRRGKSSRHVDRRAATNNIARDHLIAGHAASPWPLRLGILTALTALYAPAHAADRYWDVNGTSIGYGGTGTWNTPNAYLSPTNDVVSGPYGAW
jgi:fibronectin-binding autotransporter adhesin